MKVSVAWIDREQAHLFHISEKAMERKKIKGTHKLHHGHRRDNFDHAREERCLFTEAASELKGSDRILIIGPGVAKHHFQVFLFEQYPDIGRKIAGVETVDHPTDGQIGALAKKYFEKESA